MKILYSLWIKFLVIAILWFYHRFSVTRTGHSVIIHMISEDYRSPPPPFSTCPGGVTAVLLADGARRNRGFSVEWGGTWGQWWIHSECNLLHHYVSPVVSLGSPLRLLPLGPPHGVRYWWYLGEAVKIIFLYLQTLLRSTAIRRPSLAKRMSSLAKRRPSGIVIYPYFWLDWHSPRMYTLENQGLKIALPLFWGCYMQPEFRCNKVVTLEVIYLGTQLEFWYFVLWGFYSLALNLSIMSHLSDSQRLNVSCILLLILSIMSHLSDSRRLKVCCPLAVTFRSDEPWHSTWVLEFLYLGGFTP